MVPLTELINKNYSSKPNLGKILDLLLKTIYLKNSFNDHFGIFCIKGLNTVFTFQKTLLELSSSNQGLVIQVFSFCSTIYKTQQNRTASSATCK